MSESRESAVAEICRRLGRDRGRLLDVLIAVQERFRCVDAEAQALIARELGLQRVEVAAVVSFYAFLSTTPKGQVQIRLCDDVIDEMRGSQRVAQALVQDLGIEFGETSSDGRFSLEHAPCIGMSDQAPAALVNDIVVTDLGADVAHLGVQKLKEHMDTRKLVRRYGDGNNAHDLVRAPVHNNIRLKGEVIFAGLEAGTALKRALAMNPAEVIRDIKASRLRGRGGAGFPTGMKWEFARSAPGDQRTLICNADEGEPGTFKDRVILTECPQLLLEGMTIAAYAIGAGEGLIYLRGEYAYLKPFLENAIKERREIGLLGRQIMGKDEFDFDIRIQLGAGAYVCGEETALISSAEGWRGDPKNRPPFPATRGYKDCPTVVNNVETLCCVARILERGPGWFCELGEGNSTGTKLLSVSGDCSRPGVYEVPLGIPLRKVLDLCGAEEPRAVQVGGPSGRMVGPRRFDETICFDHLATGGSIMIFNEERDILHVVAKFLAFFLHESCGYCTPCRVGVQLLAERLDRIIAGRGEAADLEYLTELAGSVKAASRCGLGQTAPNPILSTLEEFRPIYETRLVSAENGNRPGFDLEGALRASRRIAVREAPLAEI